MRTATDSPYDVETRSISRVSRSLRASPPQRAVKLAPEPSDAPSHASLADASLSDAPSDAPSDASLADAAANRISARVVFTCAYTAYEYALAGAAPAPPHGRRAASECAEIAAAVRSARGLFSVHRHPRTLHGRVVRHLGPRPWRHVRAHRRALRAQGQPALFECCCSPCNRCQETEDALLFYERTTGSV